MSLVRGIHLLTLSRRCIVKPKDRALGHLSKSDREKILVLPKHAYFSVTLIIKQ